MIQVIRGLPRQSSYCTLSLRVLGQSLFSWTNHDSSEQQMVPHLPIKIETCKQLLKVLLQHDVDAQASNLNFLVDISFLNNLGIKWLKC